MSAFTATTTPSYCPCHAEKWVKCPDLNPEFDYLTPEEEALRDIAEGVATLETLFGWED